MESGQFSIHGSCKTNCFQISCFSVGKTRARDAALNAIQSPLLDIGIERATGIVWNITGGSDLTLFEVTFSPLPLSQIILVVMDDGFEICVLCGELGFIIYSG
jgi:cell division GTPase FtsZ